MIMSQNSRLTIDFPMKILTTPLAEVDSTYFLNVDVSLLSSLSFQLGILDVNAGAKAGFLQNKCNCCSIVLASLAHTLHAGSHITSDINHAGLYYTLLSYVHVLYTHTNFIIHRQPSMPVHNHNWHI